MQIVARGTDNFALFLNLNELSFLEDAIKSAFSTVKLHASEEKVWHLIAREVKAARNSIAAHEDYMATLQIPQCIYEQYDIHLEPGEHGPVIVQYLHHVPSGGKLREEIADVPVSVCDDESWKAFVEEIHPKNWDGDADPGDYED